MSIEDRKEMERKLWERSDKVAELECAGMTSGADDLVLAGVKFQEQFPEIADNTRLFGIASEMDRCLEDGGDTRSREERYTFIGNQLRDVVKSRTAREAISYGNAQQAAHVALKFKSRTKDDHD